MAAAEVKYARAFVNLIYAYTVRKYQVHRGNINAVYEPAVPSAYRG